MNSIRAYSRLLFGFGIDSNTYHMYTSARPTIVMRRITMHGKSLTENPIDTYTHTHFEGVTRNKKTNNNDSTDCRAAFTQQTQTKKNNAITGCADLNFEKLVVYGLLLQKRKKKNIAQPSGMQMYLNVFIRLLFCILLEDFVCATRM